jgi:hypothetical protein
MRANCMSGDYDLRSQTLLHRDAAGYYEFAHKSLAEYFVALRMAAEIGALAKPFTGTYLEGDGTAASLPVGPASMKPLRDDLGARPLTGIELRAVRSLLAPMLERATARRRLARIFAVGRNSTLEVVGYLPGNPITLLRDIGHSLGKMTFANTVCAGADFRGADLRGVDLSGADLADASLVGSLFNPADVAPAHLHKTRVAVYAVTSESTLQKPAAISRSWRSWRLADLECPLTR